MGCRAKRNAVKLLNHKTYKSSNLPHVYLFTVLKKFDLSKHDYVYN